MKQDLNESGYALVTVLLITTVFMLVFLSFIGQSFSSTKQNEKVENISQSVAVAEMGVSYYQVAIQHIFETNLPPILEVKVDDGEIETPQALLAEMRDELKKHIELLPTPDTIDADTFFIMDKNRLTVEILDDGAIPDDEELKVKIYVTGTKHEDHTLLEAEMKIDVSDITFTASIEDNNPEFIFEVIDEPTIAEADIENCINPDDLDNTCSKIIIDTSNTENGSMVYLANYNKLENKTIYSHIDVHLQGNNNSMSGLEFYANAIQIDQNTNGVTSSILETKNNFYIKGNFKNIENSEIYIGGLLLTEGHVDLRNSSMFVRGKRTEAEINNNTISKIGNQLTIYTGSTMCVNGDLQVNGSISFHDNGIDPLGHLYIMGQVLNVNGVPITNPNFTYVTDENKFQFKRQCGRTFDTPSSINWGDPTDTTVNDVIYN